MIYLGWTDLVVLCDGQVAVGAELNPEFQTYELTFESLAEKQEPGTSALGLNRVGPTAKLAFKKVESLDVVINMMIKLREKMKEGINEQTTPV